MLPTVRTTARALTALAIITAAACSGGADDQAAATDTTDTTAAAADPAAGYCDVVTDVLAGGATPPVAEDDVGTTDGLIAAFRSYLDLRHAIEDLAEAAPPDIADDWEVVAGTFSTLPSLSSPLEWAAGVMFTALDAAVAFERIDATTSRQCGQRLFSFDVDDLRAHTTPYVDDDGYTVVHPGNVFGTEACVSTSMFVGSARLVTALDEHTLVFDCDGELVGLDLAGYKVAWRVQRGAVRDEPDPLERPYRGANTQAELLAFAEMDISAASGFDAERRDPVVRAVDLRDGTELYRVVLPRPDGVDDLQLAGPTTSGPGPEVEAVGSDGTVVATMEWPTVLGPSQFRMYGIARDGTIAWERPIGHYVSSEAQRDLDHVTVLHPNSDNEVIEIATGQNKLPGGLTHVSPIGGCSAVFAALTSSEEYASNDTLVVFDADSGAQHTVAFNGDVVPAAGGIAARPDTRGAAPPVLFLTPGGEAWRIDAGLTRSVTSRYGRLFIENQSGHLLEVDQTNGEPLTTEPVELPPEGIVTAGGLLEVAPAAGGAFRVRMTDIPVLCG